jgi:hypothetical protein
MPEDPLSVVAVLVALFALVVSVLDHRASRDHNRRSVRPLPHINPANFENRLTVSVRNDGAGPLILRAVQASDASGNTDHLIELVSVPPPGIFFANYWKVFGDRAVLPGEKLILLDIRINLKDPEAVEYRDQLRQELGGLTVKVEYTDIYGTAFKAITKPLTWFVKKQNK